MNGLLYSGVFLIFFLEFVFCFNSFRILLLLSYMLFTVVFYSFYICFGHFASSLQNPRCTNIFVKRLRKMTVPQMTVLELTVPQMTILEMAIPQMTVLQMTTLKNDGSGNNNTKIDVNGK